jgi:DNA-binding Lrp family transcriptional regulator
LGGIILQLDDIDRRILEILQHAGRTTNRELAKRVGLSPAPCWHRVKRLEQAGMIDHYKAVLNTTLAGQNFRALVGISLLSHSTSARQEFEDQIQAMENVQECYWFSGEIEYQLLVTAADLADFEDFLQKKLLAIPVVSHASPQVVLKEIKRTSTLPLDAVGQKTTMALVKAQ